MCDALFQPGRPAFTEPQQEEAMKVLRERAEEIGVKSLLVAPPLSAYGLGDISECKSNGHT